MQPDDTNQDRRSHAGVVLGLAVAVWLLTWSPGWTLLVLVGGVVWKVTTWAEK